MERCGPFVPDRPKQGNDHSGDLNQRGQEEDDDEELAELLRQQDAFRASGQMSAASVSRQPKPHNSVHVLHTAQGEENDDELAEMLSQQQAFLASGRIAAASVSRRPKHSYQCRSNSDMQNF